MSSATLAASASPHSSAMRCSATSMPAVMPALEASGPSTTKTRFSTTVARGASARSVSSTSWCVVQRRPSSRPARAANSVPEQIVTRRCRRRRSRSAGPTRRCSQRAVAVHGRRDVAEMLARLTDHHDPRGRVERFRQRLEAGDRQPDRRGLRSCGAAKRRRKRGGRPRSPRCWLASRNASAGPAMSSSSECGTTTNSTSIGWVARLHFPKVIDPCPSPMRQGMTRPVPSRRPMRTHAFPRRPALSMAVLGAVRSGRFRTRKPARNRRPIRRRRRSSARSIPASSRATTSSPTPTGRG